MSREIHKQTWGKPLGDAIQLRSPGIDLDTFWRLFPAIHETFIETDFKISGAAHLICDRSLEPFDFPIESKNKIVFKYGNEHQEITDEIITIPRDTATLELGQYIYEFIALAIPLKKVHPKFQDDAEDESEGKIVYTSEATEEKKDEEDTDPRWNILKKLK